MFEVKKGDYVDCEGFSETLRKVAFAKFNAFGFPTFGQDDGNEFIGVDRVGDALYLDSAFRFERKITLEQLMFCDQPDDVMHCYLDDGALCYTNSFCGNGEKISLICTREAKGSRSWYEKGDLPPAGERVEVRYRVRNIFKDWREGCFKAGFNSKVWIDYNGRDFAVPAHDVEFRPIQTERERLIEEALGFCFAPKSKSTIMTVEALIDAGWRPKDE